MSDSSIYLVCGGKFHDFAWVEKQLQQHLKKLGLNLSLSVDDYELLPDLKPSDAIVSYTADLLPSVACENRLDAFLKEGGRWFALHGTNSKVEIDEKGYADCPTIDSKFMSMLGSQFLAHPPKQQFLVEVSESEHPLVAGITSFTVEDELYFIDQRDELEVLLHAHFSGKAMRGFKVRDYESAEPRPILYIRRWGQGQVLYLNLGHSRGHYDMQPLVEYYEPIERCSWESPEFRQLIDRGLLWSIER